ncbi:MAG: Minf_1886 family protein [Candidatus Eisenbacteria bacterium]
MGEATFWDVVDGLREREGAYAREAYGFVVGALGATVQQLPAERLDDPQRRHLSGLELLAGVVRLARTEFGPLAVTVFQEWGVHRSEDVGHIVFQLVACGQLSARPEDTMTDFSGGFDLHSALADDAEPGSALRSAPPPHTH